MKFIYITDIHLKGKNPISRKGDYYKEITSKINEVISIAVTHDVDCIIDGGDIFDSPLVSNLMIDDFVDTVEKSEIPWYMLYGNHTLIGHSIELSKATSLAHIFRRSKKINHISELSNLTNEEDIRGPIEEYIQGYDYYHNIEEDIKEKGLIVGHKTKFSIAIVHALITPKPFHPKVLHVVAKDIKTDYDIVLCGHYHQPWIEVVGNTRFINPGCIGRTSIDEAKIKPKVLIINTETKEITDVYLDTALDKEEVFDLERIEIAKKFENDIDNFIKSLQSTKFQGLNLRGLVEDFAKESKVPREIVDELINRIGKYEV